MLEAPWLPLNNTSSLLNIILLMMIMVDILFLTAQFLNINLHFPDKDKLGGNAIYIRLPDK